MILPAGIEVPSAGDFHRVASEASGLGRPAVASLMLLARDGRSVLGRLCAICALGRMAVTVPAARVALTRIAQLDPTTKDGYVVLAAMHDARWPFEAEWDPAKRLEALRGLRPRSSNRVCGTARSEVREANENPPREVPRDRFGAPLYEREMVGWDPAKAKPYSAPIRARLGKRRS
jgi:hypothetical protein